MPSRSQTLPTPPSSLPRLSATHKRTRHGRQQPISMATIVPPPPSDSPPCTTITAFASMCSISRACSPKPTSLERHHHRAAWPEAASTRDRAALGHLQLSRAAHWCHFSAARALAAATAAGTATTGPPAHVARGPWVAAGYAVANLGSSLTSPMHPRCFPNAGDDLTGRESVGRPATLLCFPLF
jgi:hypothetical protein